MMIPKKREISGTTHLATKGCPNYSFRAWAGLNGQIIRAEKLEKIAGK